MEKVTGILFAKYSLLRLNFCLGKGLKNLQNEWLGISNGSDDLHIVMKCRSLHSDMLVFRWNFWHFSSVVCDGQILIYEGCHFQVKFYDWKEKINLVCHIDSLPQDCHCLFSNTVSLSTFWHLYILDIFWSNFGLFIWEFIAIVNSRHHQMCCENSKIESSECIRGAHDFFAGLLWENRWIGNAAFAWIHTRQTEKVTSRVHQEKNKQNDNRLKIGLGSKKLSRNF